jgi:hypothetical protein
MGARIIMEPHYLFAKDSLNKLHTYRMIFSPLPMAREVPVIMIQERILPSAPYFQWVILLTGTETILRKIRFDLAPAKYSY